MYGWVLLRLNSNSNFLVCISFNNKLPFDSNKSHALFQVAHPQQSAPFKKK
jgi:hypothetical protein